MPKLAAVLTEQTASCTLPTGEAVKVSHRVPLFTLARELDARGYGDYRLQAYTLSGTPSLRGPVSVMAGLTVAERDIKGLALEKYRPFPVRGQAAEHDLALVGTQPPQTAMLVSESTAPDKEAA